MIFIKQPFNKRNKETQDEPVSWKSIDQSTRKQPLTPEASKKRWKSILKLIGSFLILGLMGTFGYWGYLYFSHQSESLAAVTGEEVLQNIIFKTDGVLTHKWLLSKNIIPVNEPLMKVDIFQLKNDLENLGQIKVAHVERKFPDALKIQVQEYQPILRLMVRVQNAPQHKPAHKDDKYKILLISKEGHVYNGAHYSSETLKHLPYLVDIKLERLVAGWKDIGGMQVVNQLLERARTQYPRLYAQWKSVSLKKFSVENPDILSQIIIETRSWGKIVFKITDFDTQLQRLNYIIRYANDQQLKFIESIDLTLSDQASLKLKNTQ